MVNFQEPYLFNTPVSLGLSGYYYNRIYTEYTEQRLGGRVGLGYQFTPDLSGSIAYRGAKINITNPIDPLLPALAEVTGRDLALHGFQVSLTHDKRDNAFLATEGHLIQASFEEVLGSFQYPHAEIDLRKYFTLYERPDGSGRHVLSLAARAGYHRRQHADLRALLRRRLLQPPRLPVPRGVAARISAPAPATTIFVGGDFELLASAEYLFPITADDMLRGVVFCDTGTVEPTINNWTQQVPRGARLRAADLRAGDGPGPDRLGLRLPRLLAARRPQRDVQLLRGLRAVAGLGLVDREMPETSDRGIRIPDLYSYFTRLTVLYWAIRRAPFRSANSIRNAQPTTTPAHLLHQPATGLDRAAGGQQIVDHQHLRAGGDGVGVDFQRVAAVLQIVGERLGVEGELARLADGHQRGVQFQGHGGGEDEPAGLGGGHHVDLLACGRGWPFRPPPGETPPDWPTAA